MNRSSLILLSLLALGAAVTAAPYLVRLVAVGQAEVACLSLVK